MLKLKEVKRLAAIRRRLALAATLLWWAPALSLAQASPDTASARSAPWKPVTTIDFSSKHDVMIRNEDGTLTPMDVPYYRSKLIGPGVWQIESDGDYQYLIEGEREALAIDTGYGAGNIRAYMQTLTKKPVRYVANTHYHFDHTANDAYFDGAYMSAQTAEKATLPYPSFAGMTFPRDYPKIIVNDGYKIDLGHREIEVLVIGNHTPGGTAYLDQTSRILFSGDEVMGRNEPLNVSVAQFAANMRKLEAHRGEFDRLAGGPGLFDASTVDKYLAAAELVLSGKAGAAPAPRAPGGGPGFAAAPASETGATVVYQRRMVRAPDRPGGMGGAPNGEMRVMAYEDCQITYDMTHLIN
ncbi:MAG TPA: MBL fold metallo-hydrolase [Caulobacteraceae bacterium]|nr:MBL fold metallo-hydrolase [Caulobacteraceae bacterium]